MGFSIYDNPTCLHGLSQGTALLYCFYAWENLTYRDLIARFMTPQTSSKLRVPTYNYLETLSRNIHIAYRTTATPHRSFMRNEATDNFRLPAMADNIHSGGLYIYIYIDIPRLGERPRNPRVSPNCRAVNERRHLSAGRVRVPHTFRLTREGASSDTQH